MSDTTKPMPRLPLVASDQYGMHFILSEDNEILWRCDFIPMPMLQAMVDAANQWDINQRASTAVEEDQSK